VCGGDSCHDALPSIFLGSLPIRVSPSKTPVRSDSKNVGNDSGSADESQELQQPRHQHSQESRQVDEDQEDEQKKEEVGQTQEDQEAATTAPELAPAAVNEDPKE